MGGRALRLVEQKFRALQERREHPFVLPVDFETWSRWKRAAFMVKRLGSNWKIQIFREPRGVNAYKATFWNVAQGYGFERPRRRRNKAVQRLGVQVNAIPRPLPLPDLELELAHVYKNLAKNLDRNLAPPLQPANPDEVNNWIRVVRER